MSKHCIVRMWVDKDFPFGCIKEIRRYFNLGLKESKDVYDSKNKHGHIWLRLTADQFLTLVVLYNEYEETHNTAVLISEVRFADDTGITDLTNKS